jgi:hypothetical protein
MKHDKRKGFLAGYRKAGPTLKFISMMQQRIVKKTLQVYQSVLTISIKN